MEIKVCAQCECCWEGPEEENTEARELCPECGSKSRRFSEHNEDKFQAHESIGGKIKDPTLPSRKKGRVEFFDGYVWSVAFEKYVKKTRVIDKRQDHYHEKVEDPDSGEVIHERTEPLSEHTNHGYATFKNDEKNKS